MSEFSNNKTDNNADLIGILMAISVVSRSLARDLILQMSHTKQAQRGGKNGRH